MGGRHGVEEAPDIRVKHPVHLPRENAGVEGVQRIMLAAPRPESVGEPEEVFLVDCFENRRDRLLDDCSAKIWMGTQRQSGWPFRRSRREDDCRGPTITQAIFA